MRASRVYVFSRRPLLALARRALSIGALIVLDVAGLALGMYLALDPYKRVTIVDRGPRKRIASEAHGASGRALDFKKDSVSIRTPVRAVSGLLEYVATDQTICESGGADTVRSA